MGAPHYVGARGCSPPIAPHNFLVRRKRSLRLNRESTGTEQELLLICPRRMTTADRLLPLTQLSSYCLQATSAAAGGPQKSTYRNGYLLLLARSPIKSEQSLLRIRYRTRFIPTPLRPGASGTTTPDKPQAEF